MNFRDMEQLSAYLDGQLSSSDSARLQSRLVSDPSLVTALESLRESRSLLRRLPHRRAPRNFRLTPAMVGMKPPLPRSYPVFRFATALATLLFAISFVTGQVGRLAAAPQAYGLGGGGGSDAATEAPAMMSPMVESPATEPPAEESSPSGTGLVMPTPSPATTGNDQERSTEKQSLPAAQVVAGKTVTPPLLATWQLVLLGIAILGALSMVFIQRFAARKWRDR